MKEQPRPGDAMFTFHPGEIVSEAIGIYTFPVIIDGKATHLSHVQTVIDVGKSGTIQVMSATAKGLQPFWVIPENVPVFKFLTYKKPLTQKEIWKVLNWMKGHEGTGYDFAGLGSWLAKEDKNAEDRLFCSEAHFLALKDAGRLLVERVDHAFVSPALLYTSTEMRELR